MHKYDNFEAFLLDLPEEAKLVVRYDKMMDSYLFTITDDKGGAKGAIPRIDVESSLFNTTPVLLARLLDYLRNKREP